MKKYYRLCLAVSAVFIMIQTLNSFAAEDEIVIFKVNTASLIVREEPSAKSKALFTLPKDSYVLNFNTSMQNQDVVTVANRKGRWIRLCGINEYVLGYVFEGFLVKAEGVKYRSAADCDISDKAVICGKEKFIFTEKTPVTGAWFKEPDTCYGNIEYIKDGNAGMLKKIATAPDSNSSAGGDIAMIVKDNKVLQFISTPPPRGGGCE